MSQTLLRVAERVLNRPLMLLPEKLSLIAQVLDGRIGIDASEFAALEIDQKLRAPGATRFVGSSVGTDGKGKVYRVEKGTAIIQVLGSLVNRGAWIGSYSGMTSYEGLAHQLDMAKADGDVERVILDIDSPGGEAVGAFEVADKVAALAAVKPVHAVVNGMAASAAYAIAAQSTRIITTPSGISGSIGVVMMHADYSENLAKKGIRPTLIFAGARKVDGNPFEPLSEAVKADLRAEIDTFYGLFVASVARGRNGRMTEKAVRGTEAKTFIGQAAVDAGIADEVGSFETVLADLSKRSTRRLAPATANPLSMEQPTAAPIAAVPAASGPRSEVDRLAIVELGAQLGLQKLAAILADQTPAECSTEAALDGLRIAAKAAAKPDLRLHPSGLYLEGDDHLRVRGGPLFAPPTSRPADDHGWDAVVAEANSRLKS